MRVLITNDDGIASDGLWALAKRVLEAGHEAVVAAPTSDMTGMGAAVGGDLHGGDLRAERIHREDLGGVRCEPRIELWPLSPAQRNCWSCTHRVQ